MKMLIEVFLVFLKIGVSTFGGGYTMIPIVERELINKKGWINMDEVMEYYTIAQITPGIIMVNLSTFVGYKKKGILGGIIATLGVVLPGAIIIIAAALFISNLADRPIFFHIFAGIRIAVCALIADTVIKLAKTVFKDIKSIIIYIVVFGISVSPSGLLPVFLKSPVLLVLASGLAGLLFFRQKPEAKP
ncbi:MAG: chromate transporter [Treponema sp.]|nr:chromate transporter [Treponema sp.]